MRAAIFSVLFLAGCAVGVGAAGPGASGVTRVHGAGGYVDPGCYGWCAVHYDPGFVHRDGPGFKFGFGIKVGATDGKLAGRDHALGAEGEPHADFTWIARSDRWALTATFGWLFQSLYYANDSIAYSGFTPTLSVHVGLRRRLYVHAGLGHAFGKISVSPEVGDGLSAGAGENRALAGLTFVFRRTPTIDFSLRLELSAYETGPVALGPDHGGMSGFGATIEGILSSF